jgi:hypothetical protein
MMEKPYVRHCVGCHKVIERPLKARNGREYMFCSHECKEGHDILRSRIKRIEKEAKFLNRP